MLDPKSLPPLTREQYELLDAAAARHAPTRRFLYYVLFHQLQPKRTSRRVGADSSWVDIPSPFIKKHFRGARFRRLAGLSEVPSKPLPIDFTSKRRGGAESVVGDVLEYQAYSPGQCRSFRAKRFFVEAYSDRGILALRRLQNVTLVDIREGRKARGWASSKLNDRHGNAFPCAVRSALEVLRSGLFDAEAVEEHLLRMEADLYRESDERVRRRLRRRLANDRHCYEMVLRQRPKRVSAGGYRYWLAYSVASSGRLYHVGGGLQTCSREMKAAAYRSLAGVKNYDLRSSQIVVLAQEMSEAGVPVSNVRRYLDEPNLRGQAAAYVGIDEGSFKRALYAVVFGAPLLKPQTVTKAGPDKLKAHNKVVRSLLRAVEKTGGGRPGDLFDETYDRLYQVLAPFVAEVEVWHRYVVEQMPLEEGKGTVRRGQTILHNRLGMRLNLDAITDVQSRRRKAAAHVLQGREAMLIHESTRLTAKRGGRVIANEHDGVVTLGRVVDKDVAAAKLVAGLPEARLVEKPF